MKYDAKGDDKLENTSGERKNKCPENEVRTKSANTTETWSTVWPSFITPGKWNLHKRKWPTTNVYNSKIYNNEDREATQMPVKREMDNDTAMSTPGNTTLPLKNRILSITMKWN